MLHVLRANDLMLKFGFIQGMDQLVMASSTHPFWHRLRRDGHVLIKLLEVEEAKSVRKRCIKEWSVHKIEGKRRMCS